MPADKMVKVEPPMGKVFLKDKLRPIHETLPPYNDNYAFTRGYIDVAPWKAKLSSLPPTIWDDTVDTYGNVKLVRPAHDAWGIGKIMFIFCDDFLQQILGNRLKAT